MTPEYLEQLADRADPSQLWRMSPLDQLRLPPEMRHAIDTGVALRRYATHLRDLQTARAQGQCLQIKPIGENGTSTRFVPGMDAVGRVAYAQGRDPLEPGVYACRATCVVGGVLLFDHFLTWNGGGWTYAGSDQRFRSPVLGWIGPLQRRLG